MIAILALAPVGARTEEPCGGSVERIDAAGDAYSFLGRAVGQSYDLTSAEAQFTPAGLRIQWGQDVPIADPSAHTAVRFLLFGHVEERFSPGAMPFAFVEASHADAKVRWRYGTGQHFPSVDANYAETGSPWVEITSAPIQDPRAGTAIEVTIPNRWLTRHVWAGAVTFASPLASVRENSSEYLYHGRATSPVHAVMLAPQLPTSVGGWEIIDAAPNSRLQGNPAMGYQTRLAGDEVPDELCRPDPAPVLAEERTCSVRIAEARGGAWHAWRFDTSGPTTGFMVVRSRQSSTGTPIYALLSDTGVLDGWAIQPPSTGHAGNAKAHGMYVQAGSPGDEWTTTAWREFVPSEFAPARTWYLVVANPDPTSIIDVDFDITGKGLTCGGFTQGTSIRALGIQEFNEGVVASAEYQGHGVVTGAVARTSFTAKNRLLAFFGGQGFLVQVKSLAMRAPDGEVMRAFARGVAPARLEHQFIAASMPAGTYDFEVEWGAWQSILGFPRLVAMDVDLP